MRIDTLEHAMHGLGELWRLRLHDTRLILDDDCQNGLGSAAFLETFRFGSDVG